MENIIIRNIKEQDIPKVVDIQIIDNNSLSTEVEEADCELVAIYIKSDLKYNGIGTKLFQYVIIRERAIAIGDKFYQEVCFLYNI